MKAAAVIEKHKKAHVIDQLYRYARIRLRGFKAKVSNSTVYEDRSW